MRPLFIFFLALSLVMVNADRNSFDCPARELAIEFAAHANPYLSAAHLQEIADALNGSPEKAAGCNVTVPPSLLLARSSIPRFRPFPLPASSAGTFYVFYAGGSDSAAGTQGAPFKTVARALAATRAGGGGGTIVLRGGTHFVASTLTLTGADSGLTIQSFPGEEAWLSRGTPLAGVTWAQVPAPGPSGWQGPFLNQNAVYGGSEGYPFHVNGTTPDAATCQAACDADHKAGGRCTIYTWHDQNQTGFKNQCWFRLDDKWTLYPQTGHTSGYLLAPPNVWVADVSSFAAALPVIAGLRASDGSRLWRARYPNFNPELGFGPTLRADKWIQTAVPIQPATQYEPSYPNRTSSYSFIHYQGGAGGICTVPGFGFTESFGTQYWCGSKTEGGGAFTWRTPVGLQTSNKTLPHLPYKNAQDAVLQVWHYARWASRMYRMDASGLVFDPNTGAATFNFAEGGYQDARGGDGGDWYLENVLEELDAPGEWYFDKATLKLYVYWNATAGTPPPTDGSVVAIADGAWGIINVTATQAAPITGLSINGVGFRDTAHVYFAPHSIPSGGDWALARLAALQLEGTEGASVDSCVFERLDGMAVLLSGYNRNARLTRNSFKWIGDSAMVAWGRTTGDPTGQDGWDGTDGNQPRYTVVEFNIASEVGIWEKQSSLYMQAKTSDSWLHGNVGFNGPRAGVNFNDGFGGNSTLWKNLIFNVCRESGDHGPFNSWDRQLFVTYKGQASTGFWTDYNHLTQNFLLSNYESQEGIDNDDGTAYYNSSNNFMMYSGNGMKSDFGGHDNIHHDNVYAYVGAGFSICSQSKGHMDSFYSNNVIQDHDGNYGNGQACASNGNVDSTIVHDNHIFTPSGRVTECGKALSDWQAQGGDPGTTASTTPSDATLLGLARAALGM